MRIKYNDFLKTYEKNNIIISLLDVENIIKDIFDDTKVSSVDTIYEKDEEKDITKLILTINNLFFDETNIIHTKFVFYVDNKKRKLINNFFHYLYDINCNFKKVNFKDSLELEEEINNIINERIFGKDLKILSDLGITMTSRVNELLHENEISNISIYNINYTPIVDNIPCDSLSFNFKINIDDKKYVRMIARKLNKNEYKISFNENDWFYNDEVNSLKSLPQSIIKMIKKHII